MGTTQRISGGGGPYDGGIARNTTRDHALGRGPYRQLRRRSGGGIRGRLAVVPPVVIALAIALLALAGFGAVTAFAFFASDLPSPEDLARDPLAQSTKVLDRDGKTLLYQFEIDDPTAFTQPWKGELTMARSPGPIYEYACHEGNYALSNLLRGYRASER